MILGDSYTCVAVDTGEVLENQCWHQKYRVMKLLMMVHMQDMKIRGLLISAKINKMVTMVKSKI